MQPSPVNTKKRPTRFVGVDYGLARLGLSVSDESKSIAFPLKVLAAEKKMENTTFALLKVLDSLEKERECVIDTLVIGLPLSMNGSHSMMTDEVVAWMESLRLATTRRIISWDERLTSVQADRALRQADMTRKKRAQHVDVTSAVLLLQNYLDAQKMQQEREEEE